jgi:hypothetical protein
MHWKKLLGGGSRVRSCIVQAEMDEAGAHEVNGEDE